VVEGTGPMKPGNLKVNFKVPIPAVLPKDEVILTASFEAVLFWRKLKCQNFYLHLNL